MITAERLKILSDTNTLRVINLILEDRLCVCELEALTDLKQSNLSRHLSKLSKAGLITRSKEAQWVYYTISDSFLSEHVLLIEYLKEQFSKELIFTEDTERSRVFKENSIGCNNISQRIEILNKQQ